MKTVNLKLSYLLIFSLLVFSCETKVKENTISNIGKFNPQKDLLIGQFDCKTDVDDLHSVAAFITLLSNSKFSNVKYHAIAGTYGMQEGLYVPPNDLFQLAFGENWSDAHENFMSALDNVKKLIEKTFEKKGSIWIAEAGQSDFSAALIKSMQKDFPTIDTKQYFHVVQHSNWNEEVTTPEALAFVKENSSYHKIADGNALGNGTPCFRSEEAVQWKDKIKDPHLMQVWNLAIELGDQYNGKEGRYNNEAIAKGGLDFSDLSETCWIFGLEGIKDTNEFFTKFAK